MTRPALQHLGHGIFALDSGYVRRHFDAIHLIIEGGRAAIIDSGTRHSVPAVLKALADLGIERDEVDYVVLTHVHLDHAGGAGELLQALPSARLTVHPRGARHMIDPTRLWQATCEVYGQAEAERMYGGIVAIPAERVIETPEGACVRLAGRELQYLDAPGHARHHVVIRDSDSGWLFAGDTFGISYREFDVDGRALAFPSSTPVQFEPEALRRSIHRMLALAPEAIVLTHYSAVRDVPRLGADLKRMIDRYEAMGLAHEHAGAARLDRIREAMRSLLLQAVHAHGVKLSEQTILELIALDIDLNAAGIVSWLDARSRQ